MNCACGENGLNMKPLFLEGEVDFVVCGRCNLAFRVEFPSELALEGLYLEAYSQGKIEKKLTNQESGTFAVKAYTSYLMKIFNILDSRLDARLLDFGAGSGELVEKLQKNGVLADGLERSEAARSSCLEKRTIELFSDFKKIPTGYYQVVTMVEVIEHLTDINATLADLARVLEPSGILFITTPNRKGMRARLEKGCWKEAQKKFHLFLFDWQSLEYHLKKAGFVNIERIRFSPVQKVGLRAKFIARFMQTLGLGGTLCLMCRRGNEVK